MIHKVFLEGGPSVSCMRLWCLAVRVLLPDSGTERLVSDSLDLIDEYMSGLRVFLFFFAYLALLDTKNGFCCATCEL